MPLFWELAKAKDLVKLIAYQDEHYPNYALTPPGEDGPVTIKKLVMESTEEIDKIMRQPPKHRDDDE